MVKYAFLYCCANIIIHYTMHNNAVVRPSRTRETNKSIMRARTNRIGNRETVWPDRGSIGGGGLR